MQGGDKPSILQCRVTRTSGWRVALQIGRHGYLRGRGEMADMNAQTIGLNFSMLT
jgi:hypothetical protein